MGDAACHLGPTCLNCGKVVGDEITDNGSRGRSTHPNDGHPCPNESLSDDGV
jgi:hypothetical protein